MIEQTHLSGPARLELSPDLWSTNLTLMTGHIKISQSGETEYPYLILPEGAALHYTYDQHRLQATQTDLLISDASPMPRRPTATTAEQQADAVPTIALHLPSRHVSNYHRIANLGGGHITFEDVTAMRLHAVTAFNGRIALSGATIEAAVLHTHKGNVAIENSDAGQLIDIMTTLGNISILNSSAVEWWLPPLHEEVELELTLDNVIGKIIVARQVDHINYDITAPEAWHTRSLLHNKAP